MNEVDKVIEMCKKNSIPISTVEKECGFSNGYIVRLRKGFFPPDRKQKLIDFFGDDIFAEKPMNVDYAVALTEGKRVMIEFDRADDLTKEMVRRILKIPVKDGD